MPFNNTAAVSARPLSLHTGMQKYLKGGKNLDKYWLAEKNPKKLKIKWKRLAKPCKNS